MPLDPNIILQQQTSNPLLEGINQFLRVRQVVQQGQRQNELVELRKQQAQREQQEFDRKSNLTNFATGAQSALTNEAEYGDFLQRKVDEGEGGLYQGALNLYKKNPQAAIGKSRQLIKQAQFEKLIPEQPKGKRINAQLDGKIIPAIESPEGFLLNTETGKRMPEATKARKGPLVSIGGENALTKAIGKKAGEQIVANKDLAVKASDSIRNANEAMKLLDEGVITGFGANFIVNAGRVAKRMGFDVGTDIENTQAFAANQGKAVLDILGSGALGAGTGISDNDRLFAKQIAAGDITLDEKAIKRIIALNAKVSGNVINRHNKEFSEIKDKSPIDLTVELPEFKTRDSEDFSGMSEDQVSRLKELRRLQGK